MFKKWLFNGIVLLSLLVSASPISAEFEGPSPEHEVYFPIVSKVYWPGMVYVPAGPFLLGCDPEHNGGYECEQFQPALRTVTLDAFYVDKFEVTNAQYRQCVEQGGCPAEYYTPPFHDPNYDNHPFYGYWGSGVLYCEWAGKRLPTYAEWEKAARGTDGRSYPWGEAAPTCELANCSPDGWWVHRCVGDTVEVGSYPDGASPYGALDMAGNAEEWVFTGPPDDPSSFNIPERMSPWCYPIKGGDDWSSAQMLLAATRSCSAGGAGFRCVVSDP